MDTLIVNSLQEEIAATKKGWYIEPKHAIKRAELGNKVGAVWQFYLRNWQWFWATLVALLAIFVS